MNQYFSRLAQRSGLASTASVRSDDTSGNTAADWSEHSVETTAPVNPSASNPAGLAITEKIESKSQQTEAPSSPSAATPSNSAGSKPVSAQASEQKTGQQNPSAKSSLISNTLSAGSNSIEQDSFHDLSNIKATTPLSITGESTEKSETLATGTKYASAIFDQPLSTKLSLPESVVEDTTNTSTLISAPEKTIGRASVAARIEKSALPYSAIEIENTGKRDDHSLASASSNALPSMPVRGRIEKFAHVASAPVQTPALSLQVPRTTSRSSIEVHIGKIELEIFSPTAKPVAPAAPVPMLAPRAAPATAFNPHRHYLRGR
jgi:hypothetical protein